MNNRAEKVVAANSRFSDLEKENKEFRDLIEALRSELENQKFEKEVMVQKAVQRSAEDIAQLKKMVSKY